MIRRPPGSTLSSSSAASELYKRQGVDDTSSTLVGTLNGKIKVYVDPYSANVADKHFYVAGYKGTSAYDAGLFYCPYVPLQQVRAINPNTFQPKIGFKTRYGMVSNPFAQGLTQGSGALTANSHRYYRRVKVANLMCYQPSGNSFLGPLTEVYLFMRKYKI